jgi:Tol biopolymer transport system component
MFDFIPSQLTDLVGLLTLALAVAAAYLLALGILEIVFLALLSVFDLRMEARSKGRLFAGLAVTVLGMSAGAGPLAGQDSAAQHVPTIEARFTRVFSSDTMTIGRAALSPDGRWIVFDAFRGGVGDIWVVSSEGGEPVRLTNGRHFNQIPQWLPSGDRIAFLSNQVVEDQPLMFYVMSIPFDPETGHAAGPARQVSLEPAREPAVSPDGRWIAYGTYVGEGGGRLRVIPSNGGSARTLYDVEDRSAREFAWSSDSRFVYFRMRVPGEEARRLMRVSVHGGEATLVSVIDGWFHAIAPDARYLVRELDDEAGQSPTLELLGRDGRVLGRVALHRNMYARYPHGITADARRITAIARNVVTPIYAAPIAGGPARQIGEAHASQYPVGWTPDNQEVFYHTRLNGRGAVLRAPVDGGAALEIPLPEDAADPIVPSPDGRYLAYAIGEPADTGRTVVVRRISDGETRVLTDSFVRGLRFDGTILGPGGRVSDGEELFFAERRGDSFELRASTPEGPSRLIRSIPAQQWEEWEVRGTPSFGIHDGRIAYAVASGDSSTLFVSTDGEQADRPLVTVPGWLGRVVWSYDGRSIVAGRYRTQQRQGLLFDLLLVSVTPDGRLASEPRFLEPGVSLPYGFQWLPDDRTVVLFGMAQDDAENGLWLIPVREGEAAAPLRRGDIWSASLSPDGRFVAYGERTFRGSSIWIVDYGDFLRERGLGSR